MLPHNSLLSATDNEVNNFKQQRVHIPNVGQTIQSHIFTNTIPIHTLELRLHNILQFLFSIRWSSLMHPWTLSIRIRSVQWNHNRPNNWLINRRNKTSLWELFIKFNYINVLHKIRIFRLIIIADIVNCVSDSRSTTYP